jgi:hypothetical protein
VLSAIIVDRFMERLVLLNFFGFFERLIHQNSSLHPDRTRDPMGRSVRITPLRSLTTGGPLHAAPLTRVCLSPAWTRRPALPGDVVKERINNRSVNIW